MSISKDELETIKLIFDAAGKMITVATGYTVLLLGALTQLWLKNRETPTLYPPPPLFISATVIAVAAGSVGFWATALGFGIAASTGEQQWIVVLGDLSPQELISLARAYMGLGYWTFLASLWGGGGVTLYFLFKWRSKRGNPDAGKKASDIDA